MARFTEVETGEIVVLGRTLKNRKGTDKAVAKAHSEVKDILGIKVQI